MITLICEYCKKEFESRISSRRFCSKSCAAYGSSGKRRFTKKEEYLTIIDMYQNKGMTITEIANKYAANHKTISNLLKSHNIPIISGGKQVNRLARYDYFQEIDSEGKAYFLGLLFADGNVILDKKGNREPNIRLELVETDIDILHKLKIELNSGSKLIYNKRANREWGTYSFQIRSKRMADDLANYYIIPAKTYDLKTLPNIPKNYLIPFLRGYLDGDGSIYYSGNLWHINFTAHNKELLENVQEVLSKLINKTNLLKISTVGTACHLTYNGKDAYKIVKLLYDNSNYHITRKYMLANRVIEEYKRAEDIV